MTATWTNPETGRTLRVFAHYVVEQRLRPVPVICVTAAGAAHTSGHLIGLCRVARPLKISLKECAK